MEGREQHTVMITTIGWPWELPLDVQRFFSQWYIFGPKQRSYIFFRGSLGWILG